MMTTFSDAAAALREQFRVVLAKCVLFATGGFALVSILGFDPNDPSFNRAADNDPVNYAGLAGAYVADPLLQFFGQAVFLVPLVCFARVFRPESAKALALRSIWLRVPMRFFSFAGMILSACALCSVIPADESWPFYTGYGGAFGDLLLKSAESAGLPGVLLWVPLFPGCLLLILCAAGYEGWIPVIFGRTAALRPGALNLAERLREAAAAAKERAVILADQMDEAPDPDALLPEDLPKPKRKQKGRLLKKLRAFQGVAEDPDDPDGQTAEDHDAAFEEPADPQATLESLASRRKEAVKKRSVKAKRAEQEQREQEAKFKMPAMNLLVPPTGKRRPEFSRESMERNADLLGQVLQDFGVYGKILNYRPGPVVTLYEMEPSPGTKSSRVIGLADDIARSMSALSARISVIPGRNLLGVELPNAEREIVLLREILETPAYEDAKNRLPLALGKDIGGSPVIADLSRMPHLLVAGTTGSGKSVAVNAMILSLLYRLPPEECRFIMIDPKMLELSVYDGIPHLLSPVVTEPAKAVAALKWVVKEMENRYRLMSQMGVRNVAGFNKRVEEAAETGDQPTRTVQTGFDAMSGEPIYEETELELRKLPFIVVIVDEMADLMLTAGKEIEGSIQRLAQMARAAGIHIIMATQRPSVDVITGVIKANFPTRISFQVTSRIDSRTILGEMGAEQLLGMGDMLYMSGGTRLTRVHGPFVEDDEVEKVVRHLKSQGAPEYVDDVTRLDDDPFAGGSAGGEEGDLYRKAVAVVVRDKRASTSYVQRQLKIGYNRAADLIDRMEKEGVVSAPNHAGKREVLG